MSDSWDGADIPTEAMRPTKKAPAGRPSRGRTRSRGVAPGPAADAPTGGPRDASGPTFQDLVHAQSNLLFSVYGVENVVNLWDNNTDSTHYWAHPVKRADGSESTEAMLVVLRKAKTDDETPKPQNVRTLPLPRAQLQNANGSFDYLVHTRRDIPVLVMGDQVDRGEQWIAAAGGLRAGTSRMRDLLREAFTKLCDKAPVVKRKPELDALGRVQLPPLGVQPIGYQVRSTEVGSEDARATWAKWLELAVRQPRGILVHTLASVIDGHYLWYDRRQSHVIDLYSPTTNIGKSTALFCCGAAYGDPEDTVIPADMASAISATSLAGSTIFGSLLLDETQLFGKSPSECGLTAFRLTNSSKRTRSNSSGVGTKPTLPYSGVTLMTGNKRFVTDEVIEGEFPGLRRRYFVFTASQEHPVTADNDAATELMHLARTAHGHLIPMILAKVAAAPYRERYWTFYQSLRTDYPDENPEIVKVMAGHLAGAAALDETIGDLLPAGITALAATRTHVDVFLAGGGGANLRSVNDMFVERVRDHISANAERWPFVADFLAKKHPHLMDDAILNPELQGRPEIVRQPLGIRFNTSEGMPAGFMINGQDALDELRHEFGITDREGLLTALARAGHIHRTVAMVARQEFALMRTLATRKDTKSKVVQRGYVFETTWHDSGDPETDGDDDSPVPPTPDDLPVDPFGSTNQTTPVVIPVPTVSTPSLPPWMPVKVTRKADGTFTGIIETANRARKATQYQRNQRHVFEHPYAGDESTWPLPLRPPGIADLATRIHDGHHHFETLTVGQDITVTDANAAHLAAIGTAELPLAGLQEYSGEGPAKQVGVFELDRWPAMRIAGVAHPFGERVTALETEPIVLTTASVRLGREAVDKGLMEPFRIVRAWTAPAPKSGRPSSVRWERLAAEIGQVRDYAIKSGNTDTLAFIKLVYSQLVSTSGASMGNVGRSGIWRPELPPMFRAQSSANLWRRAEKLRQAGLTVVALTGTDEIHVAGSPDDIFAAVTPDGKPVVREGTRLDEIKVKGGYRVGPDGEPTDKWEGSRRA